METDQESAKEVWHFSVQGHERQILEVFCRACKVEEEMWLKWNIRKSHKTKMLRMKEWYGKSESKKRESNKIPVLVTCLWKEECNKMSTRGGLLKGKIISK